MDTSTAVPEVLSVESAAAYLGISRITLYRLLHAQPAVVPGIKVGGQWKVLKSQLDAYLRGEWVPATGPAATATRRNGKGAHDHL